MNFVQQKQTLAVTLIYIRNHLAYKTRNYLNIYKPFQLESSFTEICNPKKTNIIISCIHKHPNVNAYEFNDDYVNEFHDKLSNENKPIFILVTLTNEFLDSLSPHYFLPHMLQPKRMKKNSKILTDNIFSNRDVPNVIFWEFNSFNL